MRFGLVIIGAHNGSGLEQLILKQKDKVLLIEPVYYNYNQLVTKFSGLKNIILEKIGISDKTDSMKFYYVKEDSIKKLGKEWASGIGSFKRKHLLNHFGKRFLIKENDIHEEEIQIFTFGDLISKYSINEVDYLLIDTEGFDYNIIKSINFKKIRIKKIKFEYKHLDDTFKFEEKLQELKNYFKNLNYIQTDIDKENITFEVN